MYFFTADEHYCHSKIIKYANRPFVSGSQMNYDLIERFNHIVGKNDVTIHAGDFCFGSKQEATEIIKCLNGTHIFLKGSHDRWLPKSAKYIWEKTIEGQVVVVCHYCMRTWKQSHYNSWHLFGHSHGKLQAVGKSLDVGVDTNNYFPYSWSTIKCKMEIKEDNFNLVKKDGMVKRLN